VLSACFRGRGRSKNVFSRPEKGWEIFSSKKSRFSAKNRGYYVRKKKRFSAIFTVQKRSAVAISAAISISAFFY